VIAVDTSAVAAIAFAEPQARAFAEIIGTERCLIGWPTVLECHMVLQSVPSRRGLDVLELLLKAPRLRIVAFNARLFNEARRAFDRFGRGRHRAKLNFGDCMAYAVAKANDIPLLYKGEDFRLTDVRPAAL
jgi:ribonuclease VapC